MVFTSIMTTSNSLDSKTGAGVSASWTDDMKNASILESEATVNDVARFNFSDLYFALNVDTKFLLSNIVSSLTAIEGVSYDMNSYTSRIEAEDKVNILRDSALRNLSILRDKKQQEFIKEGTSETATSSGASPVGSIVAWLKTFTGTPSIPVGWIECDGSAITGGVYDGQNAPDLNGDNRFLRGNSTSGGTTGAATHNHNLNSADIQQSTAQGGTELFAINTDPPGTTSASSLPPAYNVVWIMRIF